MKKDDCCRKLYEHVLAPMADTQDGGLMILH
jgi:hypothetical protein